MAGPYDPCPEKCHDFRDTGFCAHRGTYASMGMTRDEFEDAKTRLYREHLMEKMGHITREAAMQLFQIDTRDPRPQYLPVNAPDLCPACGAYWQCDCATLTPIMKGFESYKGLPVRLVETIDL